MGTLTGEKTDREDLAQLPGGDGTEMGPGFWSQWLHDMTYHVACVLSHSVMSAQVAFHPNPEEETGRKEHVQGRENGVSAC